MITERSMIAARQIGWDAFDALDALDALDAWLGMVGVGVVETG